VPIKQIVVSTRMSAEEPQRIRDALPGLREAKGGKEVLDTVGYKGFVANPEFESSTIAWLGLRCFRCTRVPCGARDGE
jgi:ABC-type phosphate/phosphonate transport system substrate-binding protein